MPTDQQLRCAIGSGSRSFALANNCVSCLVNNFFVCQSSCPLDVIAFHCHFTQVMQQGGHSQGPAIVAGKMEKPGHPATYSSHNLGVRVIKPLERIGPCGEVQK